MWSVTATKCSRLLPAVRLGLAAAVALSVEQPAPARRTNVIDSPRGGSCQKTHTMYQSRVGPLLALIRWLAAATRLGPASEPAMSRRQMMLSIRLLQSQLTGQGRRCRTRLSGGGGGN